MSLAVICPSRGRPGNALEVSQAFLATVSLDDTTLHFVLDEDDPKLSEYAAGNHMVLPPSGRRGMTDPVNAAVERLVDQYDIIGFIGDDHRFRTRGWDELFSHVLLTSGGGLAYAFDGNWRQGEIPTQIFGSSAIWKALGWMCLPTARHLYLDNTWRVIGEGLGRLYYFPDVVIEHMHPAYAKAEWDDQYIALNSKETYEEDAIAFSNWLQSGEAERDIDRVRQSLSA